MKIRRRTAAALCVLALLLSGAGALALVLRPSYLREQALATIRARLAKGYDAEIDSIAYDLGEEIVSVEGFRIVRLDPEREVLVHIPRFEAGTRLWSLVAHGALTDVRLFDPEILFERTLEGRFPLLDALGIREGAPPAPGGRPRVLVSGGTIRLRDESVLAPGEEVRLAVESFDWQESRTGGPSGVEGTLLELGSSLHRGTGALGRVRIRGDLPFSRQGLRMLVDRFDADEFLFDRLSPKVRGMFSVIDFDGPFGDGGVAPGLEVALREAPGGDLSAAVLVRPRGLALQVRDLPILFTGVRGEVEWKDDSLAIHDLVLRRDAAEFHVDGKVDDLGPDATGSVEFWARDLYLDQGLRNALPASVQRVWDAYALSGIVDVTAAPPGTPGSFDSRIGRDSKDAPFRGVVEARLRDGEMSYRGYRRADGTRGGFDWPLTGVTGTVRVDFDGGTANIDLVDIRGRHGTTADDEAGDRGVEVTAHGTVKEMGNRGAEVDVVVECDDLPLDDDVRHASAAMERLFARFEPEGIAAHLRVQVEQIPDLDDGAYESIFLDFDGRASFRYREKIPLRVGGVSGRVEHRKDRIGAEHVLAVDLRRVRGTTADGGKVEVDGSVTGSPDGTLSLTFLGRDVLLDGELEKALRAGGPNLRNAVAVWDRAKPGGLADFRVDIRGTESRPVERYEATLRGATAQGWGDIRVPAEGLAGTVEVNTDAVLLREVRGRTPEGEIRLDGAVHDPAGDSILDLRIRGEDFPFDETLRERLGPVAKRLEGYFAAVRPLPGLRGDVDILLRGKADDPDPLVTAEDIRGGLAPLGLRNLDVAEGWARYEGGVVTVKDLVGSMADRDFTVREGRFDLGRGEGSLAVEVRRLRFARDLLGILTEDTVAALEKLAPDRYFHVDRLDVALSEEWRKVVLDGVLALSPIRPGVTGGLGLEGIFDLHGVTFLRGEEEGSPVRMSGWSGVESGVLTAGVRVTDLEGRLDFDGTLGGPGHDLRVRLSEATAKVQDRPLTDASAELAFTEPEFRLTDLCGKMAEGEVRGSFRSGEGKPVYSGKFTVSGAHARLLFDPGDPKSPLRGRVSATVEITNPTGKGEDLGGKVRVDVVEGKLGEVPAIANILTLFDIKKPSVFTTAILEGDIKGDRIRLDRLDLDSPDLAVHKAAGGSFIWLDGRLDVNLRADAKKVSGLPVVDDFIRFLIDNPVASLVFTVNVSGTLSHPVADKRILRGLFSKYEGKDVPHLDTPPPAAAVEGRPAWDF